MRNVPGPVFTKPPRAFVKIPESVRSPVTSKMTDRMSSAPDAGWARTVTMSRGNVPVPPVNLNVPASM